MSASAQKISKGKPTMEKTLSKIDVSDSKKVAKKSKTPGFITFFSTQPTLIILGLAIIGLAAIVIILFMRMRRMEDNSKKLNEQVAAIPSPEEIIEYLNREARKKMTETNTQSNTTTTIPGMVFTRLVNPQQNMQHMQHMQNVQNAQRQRKNVHFEDESKVEEIDENETKSQPETFQNQEIDPPNDPIDEENENVESEPEDEQQLKEVSEEFEEVEKDLSKNLSSFVPDGAASEFMTREGMLGPVTTILDREKEHGPP
jgi:hypothetical protein